jgi:hypothetical protein
MLAHIDHGRTLLKDMESSERACKQAFGEMEHRITALGDQSQFWATQLAEWGFMLALLNTDVPLQGVGPESLSVLPSPEDGHEHDSEGTTCPDPVRAQAALSDCIDALGDELDRFCKDNGL